MSEKVSTTVYISKDIKDIARKSGINISAVVEEAVRTQTESGEVHGAEVAYRFLKKQYTVMEDRKRLEEKRLEKIEEELRKLEEKMENARNEMIRVRRSSRIANMMKRLNKIIASADFSEEVAWRMCREVLDEMKEMDYEMDWEEFKKHVERLRQLSG